MLYPAAIERLTPIKHAPPPEFMLHAMYSDNDSILRGSCPGAETVASHLVAQVPIVRRADPAGAVLSMLRTAAHDNAELVLVTDAAGRLAGIRLTSHYC